MSNPAKAGGESPSPSQPDYELRVGMVAYDSIRPATVGSIFPLARYASLDIVSGVYVDKGRNIIAERTEEPYLLFVDSDMIFQQEDLFKLKDALDEDPTIGAVGGIYIQRVGSYKPICHWVEGEGEDRVWVSGREVFERTIKYMDEGSVQDVDSFGTGLLLIRTEAMKEIGHPIFQTKFDEKTGHFWGEDVLFCKRLKEEGWRSCIHFGVQPLHIGLYPFNPNEMRALELPEKTDEEICHTAEQE